MKLITPEQKLHMMTPTPAALPDTAVHSAVHSAELVYVTVHLPSCFSAAPAMAHVHATPHVSR